METEKTITVAESITIPERQDVQEPQEEKLFNNAFFKEEAVRVKASFPHSGDPNQLRYLRNVLREMKLLTTQLELPWEKYIPLLYRSFMWQYERAGGRGKKAEFYELTSELMSRVTFLSQNGVLLCHMSDFFHRQIVELDKKLAEMEAG